jgi:phospholipid transport system transporter-binding protein
VSDYELKDLGEGRFELSGEMSFGTVDRILRASDAAFRVHDRLQVDFSGVEKADSAGLALLLEWKAQARRRSHQIDYVEIPGSILAIAKTTDVQRLL